VQPNLSKLIDLIGNLNLKKAEMDSLKLQVRFNIKYINTNSLTECNNTDNPNRQQELLEMIPQEH